MKYFTILFFLSFLSISTAIAQKNTLSMGVYAQPTEGRAIGHASLGYFRSLAGGHVLGLKGMYSSDRFGASDVQNRFTTMNIDLVKRWTFAKPNRRAQWNLEAGLSAAWTRQENPPNHNIGFCGTGMTPAQMAELQRFIEEVLLKWQVEQNFFTGLASSASWDYRLTKRFALGAGATFNVYYAPAKGWHFLPVPQIKGSYSF